MATLAAQPPAFDGISSSASNSPGRGSRFIGPQNVSATRIPAQPTSAISLTRIAKKQTKHIDGRNGAGGLPEAVGAHALIPNRERIAEVLFARDGQQFLVELGGQNRPGRFQPFHSAVLTVNGLVDNIIEFFELVERFR